MSTNLGDDDDDEEEDEDYVPEAEDDVEEEFAEEDLSDDPDNPGHGKTGMIESMVSIVL